jgi:hypothetical protein
MSKQGNRLAHWGAQALPLDRICIGAYMSAVKRLIPFPGAKVGLNRTHQMRIKLEKGAAHYVPLPFSLMN